MSNKSTCSRAFSFPCTKNSTSWPKNHEISKQVHTDTQLIFFAVRFLADQIQVYDKVSRIAHTRRLHNIVPYLLQAESWIPHELDTQTCKSQPSKLSLPHFLLTFSPLIYHSGFLTPIPQLSLSLQLLSFGLQGWGAASLRAPHLPTPAAPWRLRRLSCFPTFLNIHVQRKGFLWAVIFLTHLFSWRWWWAANSKCLLSSALLLHRSEQRRPMLLPRAFQTAAHKQHDEALCNIK